MAERNKLIFAIHGAGMQASVWKVLTDRIHLPCQTLSLPGHEKTGAALLPSIEQMAGWVQDQLSGHPPQSVVLMGHSMGALVALEAARHPSVSALVLLGAAASMPVHPELLRQAAGDRNAAIDMILKWGVAAAHPQASAVRAVLKEQMQAVMPEALLNDLTACHAYQHGEKAAKELRRPALVLSGQDDKMTAAAAGKILAEMMGQAQFRVLPECGHMPMVENPAGTAIEIDDFLRGL